MGYIIPLSYVSTPRMQGIREDLVQKMKVQWLFHFSDRPDCLFTAVHQKLTILIAKKARRKHERICTSSYQYWYRAGREQLFEKLELFPNTWKEEKFIPKIGNEIEERIYRKVRGQAVPFEDFMKRGGDFPVYLNLRAAFWMKVFTTVHQGADYRTYGFVDRGEQMYAMCILNSSLFWWFWVCVSDCWHITAKEFEAFRIPEFFDNRIVENLATDLEQRLEETKVHIGSKQTEYEYKHRDCLAQIDRIDAYVGEIFGLTEEEKNYISQFARKYRISRGAEDETD